MKEKLLKDADSLASTKLALNIEERLNHLITWIRSKRKVYHPQIAKIVTNDGIMAGYIVTMNEESMELMTNSLTDYTDLLNDRAGTEPDFKISVIGEI